MSYASDSQRAIDFLLDYAKEETVFSVTRPPLPPNSYEHEHFKLSEEDALALARFVGEYGHALTYRRVEESFFGNNESMPVGGILMHFIHKRGGDAAWVFEIVDMLRRAVSAEPETISRSEARNLEAIL